HSFKRSNNIVVKRTIVINRDRQAGASRCQQAPSAEHGLVPMSASTEKCDIRAVISPPRQRGKGRGRETHLTLANRRKEGVPGSMFRYLPEKTDWLIPGQIDHAAEGQPRFFAENGHDVGPQVKTLLGRGMGTIANHRCLG